MKKNDKTDRNVRIVLTLKQYDELKKQATKEHRCPSRHALWILEKHFGFKWS